MSGLRPAGSKRRCHHNQGAGIVSVPPRSTCDPAPLGSCGHETQAGAQADSEPWNHGEEHGIRAEPVCLGREPGRPVSSSQDLMVHTGTREAACCCCSGGNLSEEKVGLTWLGQKTLLRWVEGMNWCTRTIWKGGRTLPRRWSRVLLPQEPQECLGPEAQTQGRASSCQGSSKM